MRKKRIAVVAGEKEYARYLRDSLGRFLDEYADIRCYSLQEAQAFSQFEEEYVAVSAYTLFQHVKDKVRETSEMIILSLALTRQNVEALLELPAGTRALMVNVDYRTCMQVITNFYSVGVRHIEMIPYFGAGEYDRSIGLAITADEMQNVPRDIPKVINIGQRSIDLSCIVDIAARLGVESLLCSSETFRRQKNLYYTNDSMEVILGENQCLAHRINGLIRLMKQGIFITDLVGSILLCSEKAAALLKSGEEELKGFHITDILPDLDLTEAQDGREQVIQAGGQTLVAVVRAVNEADERNGAIVTVDNFEELEEKQHSIRAKVSQSTHEARYRFEDIVGSSQAVRETVVVAKRMAKSDSSVLITGESGTGKEIFAQSIHNASARGSYNFVAVNCAAIPESLLESEMFGYAEGSFTGARKGGKIGYFELAHRGTIFLDEIAEMPLLLQSKLLRVIEERRIIKLGAQRAVDVDVRIIAATNRDLYGMVEEGRFREDLYYRLNVLPIRVPSLRERSADVWELLDCFMRKQGRTLTFSEDAQAALVHYPWRGNVRELRNAVEYMTSLEKVRIDTGDLPELIRRWISNRGASPAESRGALPAESWGALPLEGWGASPAESWGALPLEGWGASPAESWESAPGGKHQGRRLPYTRGEDGGLVDRFLLAEGRSAELYAFLLDELEGARENRVRMGRASLEKIAAEKQLFFSQTEIRGGLYKLSRWGFVDSSRGRGGSRITAEGLRLSRKWKSLRINGEL